MINSLFVSQNHLFTMSSTSILSVYNVADFTSDSNRSLPKIQSSLGICLRKPVAVFQLPSLSHNAKFLSQSFAITNNNNTQAQAIIIYNEQSIIALSLSQLQSISPSLQVMFQFNISSLSQNTSQTRKQISTVSITNKTQKQSISHVMITTTSGDIYLTRLTPLMSLQVIKTTSIKSLQKAKSNSKIITESQQLSIGLFSSVQEKLSQLNNQQFVSTVQSTTDSKWIYMVTNKNRLMMLNKESLEIGDVFEINGVTKSLGQALKVVVVRNSVLVLYPKVVLDFNVYTHTLTTSLTLPLTTIDLSLMQSAKTLQSSLLMVGQCNSLYSIPYPSPQTTTRSVSISSRMGKCVRVKNNMVFVGGSDGTVDVLLNGEMLLAVMVQDK